MGVNVGVGSNAPVGLVVRAKTRNGEVAAGVNVSMELPASGPSGTLVSASVVETDAEGLARFSYVPNTVAGQFRPRARIVDTAITVDLFAANEAGQFTTLVPISGNGQPTGLQLPFASPFRCPNPGSIRKPCQRCTCCDRLRRLVRVIPGQRSRLRVRRLGVRGYHSVFGYRVWKVITS